MLNMALQLMVWHLVPTATAILVSEDNDNLYNGKIPLGRYALPVEMANLACPCLVSAMGNSISGDIVYMTGGAGLISIDDYNYNLEF